MLLLEEPVWDVSQAVSSPSGNCLVSMGNGSWSPAGQGLDRAEWQSVRDWLSLGNALVIATSAPKDLPPAILREFQIPETDKDVSISLSDLTGGSVPDRPATSTAPVADGDTLTVESDGPRWNPRSSPNKALARWQVAADSQGGVLFRRPIGQGAVYLLLDDYAWTNAGLDQGDNARVLARILDREIHGGVLAFDEYRHGHGRTESFLTFLLSLPGSTDFLWLAFLWTLLYFYGRGVRLRPVEVYRERERRTAQEHIDAVAQLYERARAAPLVVQAVARRLRQFSRSAPESPHSLEDALLAADDYVQSEDRPASPTIAIRLVTDLLDLRKRIYGTRTLP